MSSSPKQVPTETRAVTVNEPGLSPEVNAQLTDEVREVVGADTVTVPADRSAPSQGDQPPESETAWATSGWLMAMIGVFVSVVVAGIAVTGITGSWWYAGASLGLGVVGLVVIATTVIRMTKITERPDARLIATMQASGVANPEQLFTSIVQEFTEADDAEGEHRSTAVESDHGKAAREQASSITPSGGPSRAVGPGA